MRAQLAPQTDLFAVDLFHVNPVAAAAVQASGVLASPRAERRSGSRVYPRLTVGGLRTACVSRRQLGAVMVGDCLAARGGKRVAKLVFASNGHAIAMSALDSKFRAAFAQADLIHADGEPVVFASKLFSKTPVPERSATTDFIFDAADAARQAGLKFFLLGSSEAVNARAVEKLQQTYPGIEIVGRRNGYFRAEDEAEICAAINASGADVLWVGLGVPFEYEFSLRNKSRLNVGWVVTCGGCFNFTAGDYVRAPQWMQKNGLEWAFRLWREPRRLFWRYLITNPIALAMLALKTGARFAS